MTHRTGFYGDAVLSNGQLDTDFDSETSGSIVKRRLIVTVDPSDTSTRVMTSRSDEVSYVSANNMIAGGELRGHDSVMNISSLGSVESVVGDNSRFVFGSEANVTAAHGYQVDLNSITPNNTVNTLYGFTFSNMTTVPNQSSVLRKVAFANLDPEASILNYGTYEDAFGQTLGPVNHPGLIPGRYYGPLYAATEPVSMVADKAYLAHISIPYGATINSLSFVVTAAGSTGAQLRVAIYRLVKGKLSGVVGSGVATVDSPGSKTITLSVDVPAGNYVFAANPNMAVTILVGTPTADSSVVQGVASLPDGTAYVAAPATTYAPVDMVFADPLPSVDDYPTLGSSGTLPLIYYTVEV